MLLVKEGVLLSSREHAVVCNPLSYLLVGDQLQAEDECVSQAADWCDLWSVSATTKATPRGGKVSKDVAAAESRYVDLGGGQSPQRDRWA